MSSNEENQEPASSQSTRLYFCHGCSHQWMTVASTTLRCTRCFNEGFIEEVATDFNPSFHVRKYFCYKCFVRWSSPAENIVKCPKNECSNEFIEIVTDDFVPPENSTEYVHVRRSSRNVTQKDPNTPSTSGQIIRKNPGRASTQKKGKKTPKKSTQSKKNSMPPIITQLAEKGTENEPVQGEIIIRTYFCHTCRMKWSKPLNELIVCPLMACDGIIEAVDKNFQPPRDSASSDSDDNDDVVFVEKYDFIRQKFSPITIQDEDDEEPLNNIEQNEENSFEPPRDQTSSDSDTTSSDSGETSSDSDDDVDIEPPSTKNQSGAKVQNKNASQALHEQNSHERPGNQIEENQKGNAMGKILQEKYFKHLWQPESQQYISCIQIETANVDVPPVKENEAFTQNFNENAAIDGEPSNDFKQVEEISFEPRSTSTQSGANARSKSESQALYKEKQKLLAMRKILQEKHFKILRQIKSQQNGSCIQIETAKVAEIVPSAKENGAFTQVLDLNEKTASNEDPENSSKQDSNETFVDAPINSKNLNDNILNSTMISPQIENEEVCDKQGETQNESQDKNEAMDTNEREDSELDVHENCATNQALSNGSEMSLKFETIIKDGRRYMLVPIFDNVDANQNSVGFLPQPLINDQQKSARLSLIQPQSTIRKRKRQTQLSPFGNKIYRTQKRFKAVKHIDDDISQRIPITPSSSSVADTYESDESI